MSTKKQHKKITVEDLGLTPDEMTRFAAGASFLYGNKEQPKAKGILSSQPKKKDL